MKPAKYEVPVEKLRWHCDASIFPKECVDGIEPLQEFIGQDRALRALEFGLDVSRSGYNIFVTGLTGTGKASAIKAYLQKKAEARMKEGNHEHPDDWCYVHNLADPDRPIALRLPGGRAKALQNQVSQLLDNIRREAVKTFTGEEYARQRKAITDEGQARQEQLLRALEGEAKSAGFFLQISSLGVNLVPMNADRPMSQEEYMSLAEESRRELDQRRISLMQQAGESFEKTRSVEKETAQKLQELDHRAGEATTSMLFTELIRDYQELPQVIEYLKGLQDFTRNNIELFREEAQPDTPKTQPGMPARPRDPFLAFQVNVFVDNSQMHGPPIVVEYNPTYTNLFGKIERQVLMGVYYSDHTMLKPGAIHRANGGYLVLNVRDVLLSPGVWEAMKRLIRTKQAALEDPLEQTGYMVPQGLKPQPIPVELKIIVAGDNATYQGLSRYDEDFWELFKVKADFDFQISRNEESLNNYAAFV